MSDPALDVVAAVRAASLDHDGTDPLDEAAALRLQHHGLDGTEVWLDGDRGVALRHDDTLDLLVHPVHRGRGIGGALAAQALAAPGPVTAWSHGHHPAAARLAARHGLRAVRDLWVMRRPSDAPLPDLEVPDGLVLRGFTPDDEPELLRVNAAAFRDHPEQGDLDEAGFAERTAEPWFDPAGLLLVVEGRRVLAFHWTKRHDAHTGEVYVVGVDPAAQGRRLGRLVTLAGLHHLVDDGVAEVLLFVESDNARAVALYRGLGFGHADVDTHVQYARDA